jgi:hypothetical protein
VRLLATWPAEAVPLAEHVCGSGIIAVAAAEELNGTAATVAMAPLHPAAAVILKDRKWQL